MNERHTFVDARDLDPSVLHKYGLMPGDLVITKKPEALVVQEWTGEGLKKIGTFTSFRYAKLVARLIAREWNRLMKQKEGIERAKARGVYKGRPPKLSKQQKAEVRRLVDSGIPKAKVARRLGITRGTVYKYLEEENK